MQALAWLGFALGMALLLLTGSSVIKTLLIPRNLSSAIGTAVSRSVRAVYRLLTAKIDDVYHRERIMASSAPTYLFVLLVCWITCLYFAYTLGDPAPGRGRLDVRAGAGRGMAALPRLAGELRDGRVRHRRPPRPAAGGVVRAAGAPRPGAGTAEAARPPGTRDARRSRGIAAGYRHPAAYARLMTCANT